MIKKSILIACLFLSVVTFAQETTSSPYSFYGIGEVRFKGTAENRSMAGLSIAPDSIHINLQNPAGFADLKLIGFSIGGTFTDTKQKTVSQSGSAQRVGLDYLAVGLPLGKLGMGFGLIPYSSVGYKIQNVFDGTAQTSKRLSGSGGLNKVFLGFGYKLTPNLSIGADVQYNFGEIETSNFEFYTTIPNGSLITNSAILSGVNYNFGAMFQAKINTKTSVYTSLNFSPQNTLTSKNTQNISVANYNSLYDLTIIGDPIESKEQVDLKFNNKVTFGAGLGESKKWLVGAEFSMQNEGNLNNSYNSSSIISYEKYMKFTLGGFYIPNYKSFTQYVKRIVYRAGLRYEKTGLIVASEFPIVDSESIIDKGLCLGFGIPLNGTFSNINIGFELGKRGSTTQANLVQENYMNLSVGFSLNDKWFEKRKFN
jgi:long-subunit fatty acid transport protein